MIDFNHSRKLAFEGFSKSIPSRLLSLDEGKEIFRESVEAWEVISKVKDAEGNPISLTFYICFKADFPLSLPKIYLSQEDYNRVKYIPHLEVTKFICTFDEESTKTVINDPIGIVRECFQRAKEIIQHGIYKKNFDDFEEEFDAYWVAKYSPNDRVNLSYLSLLSSPISDNVKVLVLDKSFGRYSKVLHQNNETAERFIKWLGLENIGYDETDAFYLGEIQDKPFPPFNFTNKEVVEMYHSLSKEQQKALRGYLKSSLKTPTLLFSKVIKDKTRYYGLELQKIILDRNGFRPGIITAIDALKQWQKNEPVARLIPEDYTSQRMALRTAGSLQSSKKSFFVSGLGSIGSNLLHFLDSLHSPNFFLCDPDFLSISNLGRHLLTINDVSRPKVWGLKKLLLQKNHQRNIESYEQSIISLIQDKPEIINTCDAMFVCIGKDNIDTYIVEAIKAGTLNIPTFFLWVEPYLSAGHCIYIHPGSTDKYKLIHDQQGFYKYNAIDTSEYTNNNELLTMREAGCQSGYIPFSNADIILFLSSIYPHLNKILTSLPDECISFTWLGDLQNIQNKKIKLSTFANNSSSYTLHTFSQ